MNRNRTGTARLTKRACCRYTTKAPKGSVQGVKGAERKMAAPKCRHFHCKVYLVSQIASRHLKEYRTAYSRTLAPENKKWRHRSVAISIVRFIWNFQIAFRHQKEYRTEYSGALAPEIKMTTPKCRHFPFRGIPGISSPDLVT